MKRPANNSKLDIVNYDLPPKNSESKPIIVSKGAYNNLYMDVKESIGENTNLRNNRYKCSK